MDFVSKNVILNVYNKPINMHRSFNGLLSLAINELNIDFNHEVYVLFMNRDRNQFKILYFQQGHVSIFSMRLAGRIPADFTSMNKIDTNSFHQLVQANKCRNHRLQHVLGGEKK